MFGLDNKSGINVMPPIAAADNQTPLWFTEGGAGLSASYPGEAWFNQVQAELLNVLKAADIAPQKDNLNQIASAISKLASAYAVSLVHGAGESLTSAISQKGVTDLLRNKQPLSSILTSLAEQQASKGKLPFFIGKDTFTLTELTLLGQTLISRNESGEVLGDLGIGPIASYGEIAAGTAKKLIDAAGLKSFLPKRSFAVNDFIRIPDQTGGLIIQWGAITGISGRDVITTTATFTEVFPNKCLSVIAIPLADDIGGGMCGCQVKNITNSKADLFIYERAAGVIAPHTVLVISLGY